MLVDSYAPEQTGGSRNIRVSSRQLNTYSEYSTNSDSMKTSI